MGRLIVCRLVLLFTTLPARVIAFPAKVNGLAPALKVIPATLNSGARLLFNSVPEEPAALNRNESPSTGGLFPPPQFKSFQFADELPTQVSVAAVAPAVTTIATAAMMD